MSFDSEIGSVDAPAGFVNAVKAKLREIYAALVPTALATALAGDSGALHVLSDAIQATAGEFTQTAADLRYLGLHAKADAVADNVAETILVAGAISAAVPVTHLSGASGSYAVTLAPPAASMLGRIKLIQYTVGAGVVTLTATNIDDAGESGPTLDNTFSVVGQSIQLLGTADKWLLLGQFHTA